jgi:RimJ/RimL family protein N-acetyltransferase
MNALNHAFELPDYAILPFDPQPAADGLSSANQPLIRTGRLTLRRPEARDAEAVAAALGNHQVARMLIRVPQPYHVDDAVEWLDGLADPGLAGWFFAITSGGLRRMLLNDLSRVANDDDRMIGFISIEWRGQGWQLGYWLDAPHWSQGIMTEAVNAVLARFFHGFMGETVFSGAIAENTASLRIQAKLGFDITGVEDVYCVSRGEQVRLITTELTFGGYMPA